MAKTNLLDTSPERINYLLYCVWIEMKQRCNNLNNHAYPNYGGRGIKVCDTWQNDFCSFKDWALSNGYEVGLSLDREDNNSNYKPSNCRWTTRRVQCQNTRKNKNYTAFGETKCMFEWARDERCKVSVWGLRSRVERDGMDFEKALTSPMLDMKQVTRNHKRTIQLTAFGETKCMSAWLEDSRCQVKIDSLRDRLKKGMSAEEAISKPARILISS